ncbi:tyrosine-type recombinase/integrase [Leifsonia xyli]|nr:site-specific integrase [Leifsonia xyli]
MRFSCGMLSAAKADGLVTRNVVDDVKPPEVIAKNPRGSLSTEQALAVLAASANVEGTRWWVAVLDGIRQSERLGALIEGLDLDAGTLRVDWQLEELRSEHGCEPLADGRWSCLTKRGSSCPQRRFKVKPSLEYIHLYGRLALIRPKSGKSRTVPLIPPVVAVLREYLEATKDRPNPYGLLWRHEDGRPYLPHEDQQLWRDLLFRAGVISQEQTKPPKDRAPGTPGIPTTHWARHTTATALMELGIDAKIVGEIVGHVDEKTHPPLPTRLLPRRPRRNGTPRHPLQRRTPPAHKLTARPPNNTSQHVQERVVIATTVSMFTA